MVITAKELSVYKDRLTFEHKQAPSHKVKLEDVIKVQIYKMPPPESAGNKSSLEPLDMSQTLNQSSLNESFVGMPKKKQVLL